MATYGRYRTVDNYSRTVTGIKKFGQSLNDIFDVGDSISTLINTARTNEDLRYIAGHQAEIDSYDTAYSNYVNRNKDQAGNIAGQPVSLDEMTLEAFQSIKPDATQETFDIWKRNRSYTKKDASDGSSYLGVNIFEEKIDKENNFYTRNEAVYKADSNYIDDQLNVYLLGDSELNIPGQISNMLQNNTDYNSYPEEAQKIFESITPEFISSNFGVSTETAERYLSEKSAEIEQTINLNVYSAQRLSQQAQIQKNYDNVKSITGDGSLIGVGFAEGFKTYIGLLEESGAQYLDGYNRNAEFVNYTEMWVSSNVKSAIESNPYIAENPALVEDLVMQSYSSVAANYPDQYMNNFSDMTAGRDNVATELKTYAENHLEEVEAEFKLSNTRLNSTLNEIFYETGYVPSNDYIFNQLGLDSSSVESLSSSMRSELAKTIAANNKRLKDANIGLQEKASIESRAIESKSSNTGIPITITADSSRSVNDSIMQKEMNDAVNLAASESIAAAVPAGDQRPEFSLIPSTSSIEVGADILSNEGIIGSDYVRAYTNRKQINDAIAQREYSHWFNDTASTKTEWNGIGEIGEDQCVTVQNGQAFIQACEELGIDVSNTQEVAYAAVLWNSAIESDDDRIQTEYDSLVAYLKSAVIELPWESTSSSIGAKDLINSYKDKLEPEDWQMLMNMKSYIEDDEEMASQLENMVDFVLSQNGIAKDTPEYTKFYNGLMNENYVRLVSDYRKTHGGQYPDTEKLADDFNVLFQEDYAKQIEDILKNSGTRALFEDGYNSPAGTVIDVTGSARSDFLGWQKGELQLWRFDDGFFEDMLTSAYSDLNNFSVDNVLDYGAQYLLNDPSATYKDLSDDQKALVARNGSMVIYQVGKASYLANALDISLGETSQYDVVTYGDNGDIGLYDNTNGLLYSVPSAFSQNGQLTGNRGAITISRVNSKNAVLNSSGDVSYIGKDAILRSSTWDRELTDEEVWHVLGRDDLKNGTVGIATQSMLNRSKVNKVRDEYASASTSSSFKKALNSLFTNEVR